MTFNKNSVLLGRSIDMKYKDIVELHPELTPDEHESACQEADKLSHQLKSWDDIKYLDDNAHNS